MAPSGARSGNVLVTFSFDRSGRILSVQVARSSGQEALDQQALRNVRSASPIPAPPADQASQTLTVPIQFNIR
jgi:protein TonB